MKNRIFYFGLFIIGVLGVFDTISLMMYLNINMGIILPGIAGLILIVYAGLKGWIYKDKPIIKNTTLRNSMLLVASLFIISFVFIESMILLNNKSQDSIETDYLIILGAGIKGEEVSLSLKERLDKGIQYLSWYPGTEVVVSGGQGPGEKIPEAEAMKRYLVGKGIESKRILMEDKSTSTMENFKFSKALLPDKNNLKIMIVTNDFHMLRAKMLAKRNEFYPYGITCNTPISVRINSYIREYFAFIKSFFLDV